MQNTHSKGPNNLGSAVLPQKERGAKVDGEIKKETLISMWPHREDKSKDCVQCGNSSL